MCNFSIALICEKPNYEVGSSAKLSFGKTANKTAAAAVWKIDNDDDEIINPDDLLDEEDKVKPDPSSLRGNFNIETLRSLRFSDFRSLIRIVCGTTGKRKACKDCSCGLAEELAGDKGSQNIPVQKSSCGSVS